MKKNKYIAAAIAFAFGALGIHKFYLKETGAGIFYIMLLFLGISIFKMPISGFLGLVDAIILLTMSDEKFDKKYNKEHHRDGYPRQSQRKRNVRKSRNYREPAQASRKNYDKPYRASNPVPRKKVVRDNPFKRSGIKKYKEFELEGAIEDFNKGLEINPDDVSIHFNLACAFSLTEKVDKSYHHLSKAVELGFNDFDKIKTHDDLAFLRIDEGFDSFKENGFRKKNTIGTQKIEVEGEEINTEGLNDDILLSQLNKLAELRKKGIISDKEFVNEKRKLLRE